MEITCGACGEKSNADLWIETAFKGTLPASHFQCPGCKVAIKKNVTGGKVIDVNGEKLFLPEKIILERIPSYL